MPDLGPVKKVCNLTLSCCVVRLLRPLDPLTLCSRLWCTFNHFQLLVRYPHSQSNPRCIGRPSMGNRGLPRPYRNSSFNDRCSSSPAYLIYIYICVYIYIYTYLIDYSYHIYKSAVFKQNFLYKEPLAN